MATIKKVSKAKNLSAGPSKKTPIAPKVDPKGQYTKVQERTLGNMKKGGKLKKAQGGDSLTMKRAEVYKANKPVITSAQKKNSFILRNPSNLASQDSSNAAKAMNKFEEIVSSSSPENMAKKAAKKSLKKGGTVDKKWIQKAINPKHKGYCTPETKATCTPKRKALAHTLRKMAKKK